MHEKLKARAASQGKSLNTYMLEVVEREVERPTFSEVVARIRAEDPLGTADDRSPLVTADAKLACAIEDLVEVVVV